MIKWQKYFPYNKPRKAQEKVIEKVLSDFKENKKKYAIIDCGTGVGKSAIGMTIANYISNSSDFEGNFEEGAYFLTTQKLLQDQYENDFSCQGLMSLYSSSNYKCKKDKNASCKDIQTALRTNSLTKNYDNCKYDCIYKKKKKDFIENKLGITNFSYFLTEKNYSQKMPNKKVLVIDEAHNLESELTRFIEINISEYFSEKILKLKVPKSLNTQFKVFNWIKNEYYLSLKKKKVFFENQLEKFGISSNKLEEFKKITKNYEMLVSHEKKILQFISIYDKDNWVFDIDTNNSYKKFIFKPIDISQYAHEYILNYADYVIFMSATIISHEGFSLTLGLPYEKTSFVKEETPFPYENRPVIFSPAGSMSFKNINNTLPVLTEMIHHILDLHESEKGIIHTHSIKIAEFIKNNIKQKYKKRILIAYGENRNKVLEKHIKSKKNTVLLSPSMSEGVDLKGDLSAFQVICKIPFPYLGDKVVKKKMEKWKWWYNVETMRTVIQSLGRSIRSEDDKAVTYILDDDWKRLMYKSKDILPKGFEKYYYEQ